MEDVRSDHWDLVDDKQLHPAQQLAVVPRRCNVAPIEHAERNWKNEWMSSAPGRLALRCPLARQDKERNLW